MDKTETELAVQQICFKKSKVQRRSRRRRGQDLQYIKKEYTTTDNNNNNIIIIIIIISCSSSRDKPHSCLMEQDPFGLTLVLLIKI